jgi:rhodanese-related sulfurtransferase
MRSLVFYTIERLIQRKFPTVNWLSTQQLVGWLRDRAQPQPLLLDARTEAEYQVSHLPQAQRIDPYHPNLEEIAVDKDVPVVVYCSVGYRSAKIAQQLEESGFTNVYNLEGSIFQWANEGNPVFRGDRPTSRVHPYNANWGRLLKSQYRAVIS